MPKTRFTPRHQYDDAADEIVRMATDIHTGEETTVQQSYKDEVNLNTIVKRFGITDGAMPPAELDPRAFGDFSDATDFRTSLDRVREAQERFAQLPADLRKKFHNDPIELYEFVSDPKNDDEAVKLGLLSRIPAPEAPLGSKERPIHMAPAENGAPAAPPKTPTP